MSDLTPIASVDDDARLEFIAKDIELLQTTAILRVAERLAEAREIFRYRRDEGGFQGWVESRLNFSRQTAYNLLSVHERFGGSVQNLDTLPRTVLYTLAAPSTPDEACEEVIERSAAGELLTPAQVKKIIEDATNEALETQVAKLRAEAFQREAELRAEYEGAGQAKIDKAVNKATIPLQKQIQKYEERLAKIKERDEARAARRKSGADPQPKTGNSTDPAQSAAAMAAAHAAKEGEGAADTKPAKKSKSKSAPKSKPAATSHEIAARSACDPEDHRETSDGTEEVELGKVIARLRRNQPHNADTIRVCDALERRLKRP